MSSPPATDAPSPAAAASQDGAASPSPDGAGDTATVGAAAAADVAPSSLTGKAWLAETPSGVVAGTIGSQARLQLPPGRHVLANTANVLVSSEVAADGTASKVSFYRRDIGAAAFSPVLLPGQVLVGAVAGQWVYVTGFSADTLKDPGVFGLSLRDGSVVRVIEPGSASFGTRDTVARNIMASPSGLTVISSICTPSACSGGVVIEGASGRALGDLSTSGGPSALNDNVVLVRYGADATTELGLIGLATGKELWHLRADQVRFAYITDDDAVVATVVDSDTVRLTTVDKLGVRRYSSPLAGREPTLWPELSTNALAIVGTGGPFPGTVEQGVVHASVVDLSSLVVAPDVIRITLTTTP